MIVTGAPVEHLPFEDVDYWQELLEIMGYAQGHVYSTLYLCWAAQAALYHFYGLPKYILPAKVSGIFCHEVLHPECRPGPRGAQALLSRRQSLGHAVDDLAGARPPVFQQLAQLLCISGNPVQPHGHFQKP